MTNTILPLVAFDIETVPLFTAPEQAPDYVQKAFANSTTTDWNDYAPFHAHTAKIVAIAFARRKGNEIITKTIYSDTEKDLLTEAQSILEKLHQKAILTGHYINLFDIPMLVRRMIIHNIKPPTIINPLATKPWDAPTFDTYDAWRLHSRNSTSLDTLCHMLNIPSPKNQIDGSMVHDLWNQGQHQQVADYCGRDAEAALLVAEKLRHLLLM